MYINICMYGMIMSLRVYQGVVAEKGFTWAVLRATLLGTAMFRTSVSRGDTILAGTVELDHILE